MSETTVSLGPEAAHSDGAEPGATQRKRILLVEGDGFTRIVLLLRLRLAGFAVDFTSNGILGLGKLRRCHPDILLVEMKLCGLSGLELIKAARAEPAFGKRPIYVFTYADRMNRATRKEVGLLATKVFDKSSITRENLVQTFETMFNRETAQDKPRARAGAEPPVEAPSDLIMPGVIEQIIAGVREQCEVVAKCRETGTRVASGGELRSRVSSLASGAEAAGLANLARQAKALENFLVRLCGKKHEYTDAASSTVTRAVDVMSQMSFEKTGKEKNLTRFTGVIVDEAPPSNRALEKALRNAGFEPTCFQEPARARQYLASNRTKLIIVNVLLPEAHGLARAGIRQLPLHLETPVLFGSELTFAAPLDNELPTSGPRLDLEPLSLAELVVKALNEVQSTDTPAPACPVSASAAPGAMRPSFARPSASASPTFEDGFDLFARPAKQEELAAPDSSPRSDSVAADESEQPLAWPDESPSQDNALQENLAQIGAAPVESEPPADLFIAASIPSEPIPWTAPGTAGEPGEVEYLARLPESPIEGSQIEEQLVEVSPLTTMQSEAPQPPQLEPTVEPQTAAAAWLTEAASDTGQAVPAGDTASALEQNEAAAVEESAAATPNYEEVMNNQLETAPTEFVPQDEASQQGEALNGHKNQREDLAARVCAAEMAVYRAQVQIERRDKVIEALQKQLTELTAGQGQAGREPAADVVEQKAQARCAELEQELGCLRQTRDELANKLTQELKPIAESGGRPQQLEVQTPVGDGGPASEAEQQVRQGVAALARATAELAKERGERQRSEQRTAELNARLEALHQDLSTTLNAQREDLARISALEEEQRQTSQALDRRTADVEQQQSERRLAEEQLQKAKEINAQLRKDLSFYEAANKKFDGARQDLHTRLEAGLSATRANEARLQQENAERQRLAESLEGTQRELQNQTRRRETLEQELQNAHEALEDREARLQKETAERQRLKEALDAVQRNSQDHSERDLEFSKLQSALQIEQVERKRQETQLARARQSALDAAHGARALRTSLRRQIREPVDNLVQSARNMLELEIGDAQKKLAEAVLQDVLLVQTRLREPEPAHGEPAEAATPPATTGT